MNSSNDIVQALSVFFGVAKILIKVEGHRTILDVAVKSYSISVLNIRFRICWPHCNKTSITAGHEISLRSVIFVFQEN